MNIHCLVFLFIVSISYSLAFSRVAGRDKADIVKSAQEATVDIKIYNTKDLSHSTGTGFFLGKNGHIITSAHVIWPLIQSEKALHKISITDYNNKEITDIEIVNCFSPSKLDLCLLKTSNYEPQKYFKYDKNYQIGRGNFIAHIGHCKGNYTFKEGKIKDKVGKLNDYYPNSSGDHAAYVFEGEYGACPGDSGAAMFSIDGISKKEAKLLGVITGGRTKEVWSKEEKKYIKEYSYKYAIMAREIKRLFTSKEKVTKNLSGLIRKSDKTIRNEKLKDAKKRRNLVDYTNTLFGVE